MLVFAQASWLFLLPLPLIFGWILGWLARRNAKRPDGTPADPAILHPHAALLADLAPRRHLRRGMGEWGWLLGCLLLIIALARPQWLDFSSPASRQGHELMVAIDVSGSMRALDLAGAGGGESRLDVVKRALGGFLQRRGADHIGVILFGDHAATYVPLTTDLELLQSLVTDLRPGLLGEKTALGDALALAVARLRDRPRASRLLLLFSDGANTAGRTPPETALAEARRHGVRIFCIAVGTADKVLFPRGPVMAPEVTRLPPDEALLRRLAEDSGGAFYHATSATDMARILSDIDARVPSNVRDPARAERREWYRLPLAVGLLLLLLGQHRRHTTVLP